MTYIMLYFSWMLMMKKIEFGYANDQEPKVHGKALELKRGSF